MAGESGGDAGTQGKHLHFSARSPSSSRAWSLHADLEGNSRSLCLHNVETSAPQFILQQFCGPVEGPMVIGQGGVQAAEARATCPQGVASSPKAPPIPNAWLEEALRRKARPGQSPEWAGHLNTAVLGGLWGQGHTGCSHLALPPASTAHRSQELGVGPSALPCPHPSQGSAKFLLQLPTVHFPLPPCSRSPCPPKTHSAPSLSSGSTELATHPPAQPRPRLHGAS